MATWKVKYHCLRDRDAHMPFWKRSTDVEADSRKDAIAKVMAAFPPPAYGNYTASTNPGGVPNRML